MNNDEMKIISFNSYKGGACRTTTCYNTLPYLAKELGATSQQPIIVYDIDLDSMGLTSIFHESEPTSDAGKKYSAKNLFVDDGIVTQSAIKSIDNEKPEEYFGQYYEKVGEALGLEDNGSVLFLGADREASTITDAEYKKFANNPPINDIVKSLRDMNIMPKAIVFDCASGVQMTTLVALQLADCVVVCMRPTYQFRVGTADYILRQIPLEIKKNTTNQKRQVILLPTAVAKVNVPAGEQNHDKALAALNKRCKNAFDSIERDIVVQYKSERKRGVDKGYVLNEAMLDDRDSGVRGLPEVERFKWQEELLHKVPESEMTEQEMLLQKRYQTLAKEIAKELD